MASQNVDPETDESASHAALTWLAGFALSASYGLGATLLTMDRDFGLGVSGFVFLVVSRLFLIVPRYVQRKGRARRMFLHALVIAIGSFVAVKLGFGKTAWLDLEDRYAATDRASGALRVTGNVLLIVPLDVLVFAGIEASFGRKGAILEPDFPANLMYEPLQFPLANISACGDVELHPGYTQMQLVGMRAAIGVPDPERKVLAWCRENTRGHD